MVTWITWVAVATAALLAVFALLAAFGAWRWKAGTRALIERLEAARRPVLPSRFAFNVGFPAMSAMGWPAQADPDPTFVASDTMNESGQC